MRALILTLVLLAPGALAAPGSIDVSSAHDVVLSGEVVVEIPAAGGRIVETEGDGAFSLAVAAGSVRVLTWRELAAGDSAIVHALDAPRVQVFDLGATTIRGQRAHEPFEANFETEGVVMIRGTTSSVGLPRWLETPMDSSVGADPTGRQPELVAWRWEESWPFVGHLATFEGFPRMDEAWLDVAGPTALQLDGGRVEFQDAEGNIHAFQLGVLATEGTGAAAVVTRARMILEADLSGARLPLARAWGFAGPSMTWMLQGEASWARASARYVSGGEERSVADEPLLLRGVLVVAPAPRALASTQRYHGEGDFEAIVGSASITPEPEAYVAPVLTITLLALAAALAGLLLYSRLSPADVLAHPLRARLRDEIGKHPGVHLRDLHRRVGGAWGPFRFHVATLSRGGHVALRKEGRYLAAYLPGGAPGLPQPHTDLQRRILASLPLDGNAVELVALRASLGISRQLLHHHVNQLESAGTIARDAQGGRVRIRRASVKPAHPNRHDIARA